MKKRHTVLDLFCGCGGLSLGFLQAGYHVVAGIDNWADAIETFNLNHSDSKGICKNLLEYDPIELQQSELISEVDVIVGGPPCQGFSIAGKRIIDDERNQLYKSFLKFVDFYKPKAFVMENVPNILSIGGGAIKSQILSDFEKIGYTIKFKTLLASDFGIPQNRRRTFFVGLKNNLGFNFPEPNKTLHKVNSSEAISDLPSHSVNDGEPYITSPNSEYQKLMRSNSNYITNHQATIHKEKTIEIIKMVPDGGNYKDLPQHLHSTRKVNIAWTRLNSQKPSFTIDTGHNHHFHYDYNRVPTARESARLQSFPDDFIFSRGKTSQLKQIGNAVPPMLANVIAETLKAYL